MKLNTHGDLMFGVSFTHGKQMILQKLLCLFHSAPTGAV